MRFRYITLVFIAAILQACGGTQIKPGQANGDLTKYKTATISSVTVTSDDADQDELAKCKEIETYAREKLRSTIAEKKLAVVDSQAAGQSPSLAFNLKSSVHFGSGAARYFAGFGAGKGTVESQLEIVDSVSKKVIYNSSASSELSIGAFGGDMKGVVEDNIEELLQSLTES